MTGALDARPNIVDKVNALSAAVYELQRRSTGSQDPLSIGDMVDVQDDGLVDGTITKSNNDVLTWRASDGVWVPKAGGGGGSAEFPITDPVGDAEIDTSSSGTTINVLGSGDFNIDMTGNTGFNTSGNVNFNNADTGHSRVSFNNDEDVRFNNAKNVEILNSGFLIVTSTLGVFVEVASEFDADVHMTHALEVDDGWNLISSSLGSLVADGGIDITNNGGGDGVQIGNSGSDSSVFGLTQNDDGGFLFANNGVGMTIVNDAGGGFQVIGKLGFFGVTPVAQQSTPSTLPQVISLLQAYGLCP